MANISDLEHGDWVGYIYKGERIGILRNKRNCYCLFLNENQYNLEKNADRRLDETYQRYFSGAFMVGVTRILRFPDEDMLKDWVYGKIDV